MEPIGGNDNRVLPTAILVSAGYFVFGAAVLIFLSVIQKLIISAPLEPRGFIIPLLYGGVVGTLIGRWAEKLKRQNRALVLKIAERQYLLRDLHHRIQNNLQIVSSLISLDASGDTGVEQTQDRIDLMAALHRVLYDLEVGYQVELPRFLSTYVNEVCQLRCNCHGSRTVDADTITVPLDTAVVIGMILNELVGRLDKAHCTDGREPRFELRHIGDARCRLTVTVPGMLPDPDGARPDSARSVFGSMEVPALLAQQISAEISETPGVDGEKVVSIIFCPTTQRDHEKYIMPATEGASAG
jgi:hypothetical protein